MPDQEKPPLHDYQLTEFASSSYPPSQQRELPHLQSQGQPVPQAPYTPYVPPAYPYPYPYPPAPYPYPPVPAPKKPLYFPLTRGASIGKQMLRILLYTTLMIALVAPLFLFNTLDTAGRASSHLYTNPDGTPDGLFILSLLTFVLLLIPTLSLLTGAFFGAVRAFLVVCLVEIGTAAIVIAGVRAHNLTLYPNPVYIIFLLLLPCTASIVGLVYDYRRHAAWWKSYLAMLLGATILAAGIILFSLLASAFSNYSTTANTSPAALYIGLGIVGIIFIAFFSLLMAGIEGITHAIIAARRRPPPPQP